MPMVKQHALVSRAVSSYLIAGAFLGPLAMAQEAQQSQSSGPVLQTIIVTARKVSENLQDVPLTDNVITSSTLANQNIVSTSDISDIAPNVIWNSRGATAGAQEITIRGIPSNDSVVAFDPGVGVYVDGVYQASGLTFNTGVLDLASIQVLKGPQGTLFGRNTTAGAIVVTTVKPSFDTSYIDADVQTGNYDYENIRAVANMPLSDDIALKLSGIYLTREGYTEDLITDSHDVNNEDHYGGEAQLLFDPTDNLEWLAEAYYFQDRGANDIESCYGPGPFGNLCPANPTPYSALSRDLYAYPPNQSYQNSWGASLHGTWLPGDGYEVTSITAYSRLSDTENQDVADVDALLDRSGYAIPKLWDLSQELRLATPQKAPLRGVGGLYYFHEYDSVDIPLTLEPELMTDICYLAGGPQGPFSNLCGAPAGDSLTQSVVRTDSYALFGQLQYDITQKLTAEGGFRYNVDRKTFNYSEEVAPALTSPVDALENVLAGIGIPVPITPEGTSHSWEAPTGDATLSYHLTSDLMLYGRYARGYKSGGFNMNTSSNPVGLPVTAGQAQLIPFNPEYVDSYELGEKFESADRRLRLNVAAFYINYTNLQVETINPVNLVKTIINAPAARSIGAEAELTWLLMDHLQLSANIGGEDAQYTNFVLPGANYTHNYLEYSPKYSGSLSGTYTFPLGPRWQGVATLTTLYNSGMWLYLTNAVTEAGYAELSGRIGAELVNGRFGVYLWSDNMTNVSRITGWAPGTFSAGDVYENSPVTFGLELRARL